MDVEFWVAMSRNCRADARSCPTRQDQRCARADVGTVGDHLVLWGGLLEAVTAVIVARRSPTWPINCCASGAMITSCRSSGVISSRGTRCAMKVSAPSVRLERVKPRPVVRKPAPVSSNVTLIDPPEVLSHQFNESRYVMRFNEPFGERMDFILGGSFPYDFTDYINQSIAVPHAKEVWLCN